MYLQLAELDPHNVTVQGGCYTIFGEDGHLLGPGLTLLYDFDRLTPACLLTVIDLPQVQHLPLNHPPTPGTSVLHDTPVAVFFAVFKAGLGAQKHAMSFAETKAQSSTTVGTTRAFVGDRNNPIRIISELTIQNI
jgi:hypothetical protein